MRMILILLSAVFWVQSTTYAQSIASSPIGSTDDSPEIQAAIDLRNEFLDALVHRDFTAFAHQGMDAAIHQFADQLTTDYQDQAAANELLAKWSVSSKSFEASLLESNRDLGDHSPMFPWINSFLDKLAAKYGTIIYTLPIVKDIQTVNYALTVVFNPHGAWQSDAASQGINLSVEYRKHFIPFANLITYYATLFGCEYLAQREGQPQLKKICKPVAQKLEYAMGRYVAPVVSDWIYNSTSRSMNLDAQLVKYNTVDELRQAIKHQD